MIRADLVTVYHNDKNYRQHLELFDTIQEHEPEGGLRLIGVDNRTRNRGFAAGCNLGAFHPDATAPIIGFLNPDVIIDGPFISLIEQAITKKTVIAGCRFQKHQRELDIWGVRDWVCGAALFVDRTWFTGAKGFDTQFEWSHEETDLIRQAEHEGYQCQSLTGIPIEHHSPEEDTPEDVAYKRFHFAQAQRRFIRKWGP